jgi:hypothetical protein
VAGLDGLPDAGCDFWVGQLGGGAQCALDGLDERLQGVPDCHCRIAHCPPFFGVSLGQRPIACRRRSRVPISAATSDATNSTTSNISSRPLSISHTKWGSVIA